MACLNCASRLDLIPGSDSESCWSVTIFQKLGHLDYHAQHHVDSLLMLSEVAGFSFLAGLAAALDERLFGSIHDYVPRVWLIFLDWLHYSVRDAQRLQVLVKSQPGCARDHA